MTKSEQPTILYVDDDAANRLVFDKTFGGRFVVRTARCADEALALMAREPIGVLITDQRMPGMSGNELLHRVKHLYPDVVRFVITAHDDSTRLLEAVNKGLVARYFIKPWNHDVLTRSLEWALEAHRLTKENSALQMRLLETERLATLGIIGSGMLHDLNQPLAYMLTNAQRLQQLAGRAIPALGELLQRHAEELQPDSRMWLDDLFEELSPIAADMLRGGNTLRGMTQELGRLLYPKPRDAAESRCEPVEITRYALSMCKQIAMRHDAQVSLDLAAELPAVRMGPTELIQTVINLVKNAAEAVGRKAPAGGTVVLHAHADGERVHFAVTDDGPGMPAEVLQKVGRPFFTTRNEGTGLGIAQCKRLVQQAGGSFEVESREGSGTAVRFAVPVA